MKTCIIDIDGVCADFTTAFKQVLDRCEGSIAQIPLPPKMWDWDVHYYSKEISKMAWHQVREIGATGFWGRLSTLDPKGMAKLAMAQLEGKAHPYFVTNRNFPHAERISERWLERHISYPKVISTQKKGLIAKAVDAEFYVEDKAENAIEMLREMGTKCRVYLIKYPYNENVWGDKYIIPVKNLSEALEREGL